MLIVTPCHLRLAAITAACFIETVCQHTEHVLAARQGGRGATLFQYAALWGREDILEHLVEKLKPTPQRRADA